MNLGHLLQCLMYSRHWLKAGHLSLTLPFQWLQLTQRRSHLLCLQWSTCMCTHRDLLWPHLLPHISPQPLLTLLASLLGLEHAFPNSSVNKKSTGNAGSLGWEDPWWRERLPTPVFWLGEFHGLCSPWAHKNLHMTERLSLSVYF